MKKKQFLFLGIFAIYCLVLIYILFFNGRRQLYNMPLIEYIQRSVNFVPFRTITNYINNVRTGMINFDTIIYNLIGNFLLFLPMGFLLPATFKKINTVFKCIMIVSVSILVAETLQLILQIGVFDIDDFVLNLFGALAGFGLFKIKPVKKFCMDTKCEKVEAIV